MSDLTPRHREQLSLLDTLERKVRHVHGLVEQFATIPREAEAIGSTLRRGFSQLKMHSTTAGFERLAQICNSLEMTSRRGMSHGPKARALREGVGTLSRQVDLERRSIMNSAKRDAASPG